MITGVETAGLVLAILPLLISALEHYNEGSKPLKDFVRYKQVIRQLVVDLSTQQALFRNTLEKLLCSSVSSDLKLAALLEHPGGREWQDDDLALDLKRRLQGSYDVYMASVNDMEALVQTLQESIGLNKQGIPEWIDARSHKKAWKKFIMCLSRKEHERILSRMDQDNRNLKNLTKDTLDLEPVRTSRRKTVEPFRKIRDYAKSLHNVLKLGWSCTCMRPHRANLRLETRECDSSPSFRVLFSINDTATALLPSWQETDIRPLQDQRMKATKPPVRMDVSSMTTDLTSMTITGSEIHTSIVSSSLHFNVGVPLPDQTKLLLGRKGKPSRSSKSVSWATSGESRDVLKGNQNGTTSEAYGPESDIKSTQITSLCRTLAELRSMELHETCLGCLVDEDRYLGVFIRRSQPVTNTTSLEDALSCMKSPDRGSSMHMTKKQRLQIAVILASTALQLQDTAWLGSQWSKKDILFHHGVADHPYIAKMFQDEPAGLQQADARSKEDVQMKSISPIRNEALFNLGVLLLELSFGKPLQEFKTVDDPPIFTEFAIARRLVETLAEEEASGYADAARACIFCDFGTKYHVTSLDNEGFRQAVYHDVVIPLEDEWKHWNRRS